jgi:YidC/Oxa1 family membrane protein insertase
VHLPGWLTWLYPFVFGLSWLFEHLNTVIKSPGWTLVAVAAIIRLAMWPLNTVQFKAMIGMQKIAPQLKKLQAKYKEDPTKLQQEQMQLYRDSGVNPLAGCWPTLLQIPILFSVFYAITEPAHNALFKSSGWLWIGSPLADKFPQIFAASLFAPDVLLIVLYAASQYVSMRYATMPPSDPAQAQQMKIMQLISPAMFAFIAFRAHWPSAMVVYWFAFNVFTMGQQFYLLRRYHQPLSAIDSEHAVVETAPALAPAATNGAAKPPAKTGTNGSPAPGARKAKSKKRK